jgi:hypothetical protein
LGGIFDWGRKEGGGQGFLFCFTLEGEKSDAREVVTAEDNNAARFVQRGGWENSGVNGHSLHETPK